MIPSGDHTPLAVEDIRNHKDDYTWLATHVDTIYGEIRQGLARDNTAQTAIEMLILAIPYVTTQAEAQRWEELLNEALRHAMILADNESLIQLWAGLGEIHLQHARYRSASKAFEIAFRRATSTTEVETMLLARIGMLRTHIIYSKQDIEIFIHDSLCMAREINNRPLIARLHSTLAVAYAHQARTQQALGHGQVALAYWYDHPLERNRTLIMLAETCRIANLLARAVWYLEQVTPAYDDSYEDALEAYARGATLVELLRPAEALHWLEYARTHFAALERRYMTGATYQTIALAQIDLKQFEQARANLRQALIIWEQVDNQYQRAEAVYTLAYLYHTSQQPNEASDLYNFALEIAEKLVPSPMVDGLIVRIKDDLDRLNGNRL